MRSKKPSRRNKRSKNGFKFGVILILLPFGAAIFTGYYLFSNTLAAQLGNRANSLLVTDGWQAAQTSMASAQPAYGTKNAYYKLLPDQDLKWAAEHFGVDPNQLQQINPGKIVPGTTISLPPVQKPLASISIGTAVPGTLLIQNINGAIHVNNSFQSPKFYTNIPQLYQILKDTGAIVQVSPRVYMIAKPLYIDNNIRVDITNETVDKLQLKSSANFDIVALTFDNSEALFKNVQVSSIDPATQKVDTTFKDGRSFVRAYESARMDAINSSFSYLGMDLTDLRDPAIRAKVAFISQGGIYGVSWRIPTGSYGQEVVTGWIQNSEFNHNHIGSFTFGASGMMWTNNLFTANDIYGLDPHDDSNNATIQYNRFIKNGKHGFIVSKRCDFNVIRDNISIDNKFHGFMLHEDSHNNIIEDNVAIGNVDNFVIYNSNYNTIRDNRSYNPRSSHVRINAGSEQNYVQNNSFFGGKKGVYMYGSDNGVAIENNTYYGVGDLLITNGSTRVIYTGNKSEKVGYSIKSSDRVVFGYNLIDKHAYIDMRPLEVLHSYQNNPTAIGLDIL
jgi:parallel beta-helix repeat protein